MGLPKWRNVTPHYMSHFLLTYGDDRDRPLGMVIMEAPSMSQARVNAVVRRLVVGVSFGDCVELSGKMMTEILPTEIGVVMSGAKATKVIRRLVQGRDAKSPSPGPVTPQNSR
jgi:hypothetical protein